MKDFEPVIYVKNEGGEWKEAVKITKFRLPKEPFIQRFKEWLHLRKMKKALKGTIEVEMIHTCSRGNKK